MFLKFYTYEYPSRYRYLLYGTGNKLYQMAHMVPVPTFFIQYHAFLFILIKKNQYGTGTGNGTLPSNFIAIEIRIIGNIYIY